MASPAARPSKTRGGSRARSEPSQDLRRRAARILRVLDRLYPDADCSLLHGNPFELLVATILSAQCTDARVNIVTRELFARWPDAAALATADLADIEDCIRSTGFFRNKARAVLGTSRLLVERHGGRVPASMEALLSLPGVARKTANVVLGNAFGLPAGVVVDTHVARLARRLHLTEESDPVKIERDLSALFPKSSWIRLPHALIAHGRAICPARRPYCGRCALAALCPSRTNPT